MKHKYETIIYWSNEDNRYVAVIVDEWIETADMSGRVIPSPKGKLAYA